MRSQIRKRNNVHPQHVFTREERAVMLTILYADIFHFPMRKDEIWKYLIFPEQVEKEIFESVFKKLPASILSKGGYYTLQGNEENIKKREENKKEVHQKILEAQKTVRILSTIPSILFIGISGGLAAENVTAKDDIDLFIIARKDTIYTTRFWILFYLTIMNKRRVRNASNNANKFCINLIIDETELAWSKNLRDVYTAHEIVQVKPLFQREDMYARFLQSNEWIQHFLPNALKNRERLIGTNASTMLSFVSRSLLFISSENLLRKLQLFIMRRHRTSEIITKSHLAFHPRDYRAETLTQLRLKMRQFGLLTKF